ncbi:uncharacterized protein A1O9_02597 [Exophiala aquamarina CBS 119918]|uniref:Uncharacterized protein n=1 Tax=Exophiala aquamarina CBS 119918 TaxID=1182545 RepID=A0A072PNV8_9EURO|nr:uncharacterized protein A1O9_02597 [Exophiala aquamarina CBS 119918]KEF61033.1 hypothetical protein A1O9_02597 [Exophiala aquamarina CBS 119918]
MLFQPTTPASIPSTYIRGGTSKALFFHDGDLPPKGPLRDSLFLRIMGSPDPMQIDGMGGTHIVTSKIAVIAPSQHEAVDVDYTFYQLSVEEARVSCSGNCGNISAGVGPFAINEGIVKTFKEGVSPDGGKTRTQQIRIFNTGTQKTLISHVPIDEKTGRAKEKGEYAIAGCPGTGAPILMDYRDVAGGTLDKGLLPTGNPIDEIKLGDKTVHVTITDMANLFGFARAKDLLINGGEKALDLTGDNALIARVKRLRGLVAQRVGLCKDPEKVDEESPMFPMIVLISKPTTNEPHVQSRLFLDNKCHTAMALTGAVATTACGKIRNSVINLMLDTKAASTNTFKIQHPGGILPISVQTEYPDENGLPSFETLSFMRTSRYLFKGDIFIPEDFQDRYYGTEVNRNQVPRTNGVHSSRIETKVGSSHINDVNLVASESNLKSNGFLEQSSGTHINGTSVESKDDSNITDKLVKFVMDFGSGDLTDKLRHKLSELLLDYIGMAVSGATIPESSVPFQTAVKAISQSSSGTATVIGTNLRMPPPYAALLNGAHAHSLDFDDTHMEAALHPGVPVVSAALAEAETSSCNVHDLLGALAIGYEITCRLGVAIGASGYTRGFHNTATCGIFGAVAAIAKLRNINSTTLKNAFGLALSMASGSMQYLENGSWNKRLHPGLAAKSAFEAVMFAEAGVLGAALPIEGAFGFLHAYSGDYNTIKLTNGLGSEWSFLKTALKPYPACRMTHGMIELADRLANGSGDENMVDSIKIKMSAACFPVVGKRTLNKVHPQNIVDAQFSVYYQAAVSFLYGSNLGWSVYDHLHDDQVKRLSDKIRVEVGDVPNLTATTVTVTRTDGSCSEASVDQLLWEEERPVTWNALEKKFRGLVNGMLDHEKIDRIVDWTKNMSGQTIENLMVQARL